MLGLIIGFLISETTDLSVIVNVCLGAAIALGMSGISSAYVSESAERKRALLKLEEAMIEDLHDSAHGEAAREVPILIALVNGCAPLIMSLLILTPLFLANAGFQLALSPLYPRYTWRLSWRYYLFFCLACFWARYPASPGYAAGYVPCWSRLLPLRSSIY
jgi:hypothetical protein